MMAGRSSGLSADQMRAELETVRRHTSRPLTSTLSVTTRRRRGTSTRLEANVWRDIYVELGLDPQGPLPSANRCPFDNAACDLVMELKPEVVGFHFGLPDPALPAQVKASGAKIMSSATTVDEALRLEQKGCDAIIAQGYEAGGHRGMFLSGDISTQAGTMAPLPQIVDAVKVPVIASGGIADARAIVAAFALGAAAVKLGTAYLLCLEATLSAVHRKALKNLKTMGDYQVFSGHPARGIVNGLIREVGPMSPLAPPFPLASSAIAPLRKQSEAAGSEDFAQMWSGQAGHLCRELPAGELTRQLAAETLSIIDG